MASGSNWLGRYRDGDRDAVWQELDALGDRVRDPEHAAEAQAVCDEWALSVRSNIEVIIERLRDQGYRFHVNDDAQSATEPFAPPSANAADYVRWLEEHFGPVPMTVSSWVRIVGDVWLVGTHPHWPDASASDPFVLELEGTRYPGEDMRAALLDEFEEDGEGEPFQVPVAPDALHKDNVSGGPPYGIALPDGAVDATLFTGDDDTSLVQYMRDVFDNGGFPGNTNDDTSHSIITSLREGLLPL